MLAGNRYSPPSLNSRLVGRVGGCPTSPPPSSRPFGPHFSTAMCDRRRSKGFQLFLLAQLLAAELLMLSRACASSPNRWVSVTWRRSAFNYLRGKQEHQMGRAGKDSFGHGRLARGWRVSPDPSRNRPSWQTSRPARTSATPPCSDNHGIADPSSPQSSDTIAKIVVSDMMHELLSHRRLNRVCAKI